MRVGTYNIMKPNDVASKHNPKWDDRKHDIVRNIAAANLDVVCVQELAVKDAEWLKKEVCHLGYSFHYEENPNPDKTTNLAIGVMYKTAHFDLVGKDKHIFQKRCCLQLDLKDKVTQKVTRVAGVHLYGGASRGNELGMEQLRAFRSKIESNDASVSRLIIAGDFNSDVDEELGRDQNTQNCSYLLEPQGSSSYKYGSIFRNSSGMKISTTNKPKGRHLDWVFVGTKNPETFVKNYHLQLVDVGNQIANASDHKLHAISIEDGIGTNDPFSVPNATQNSTSSSMPSSLSNKLSRRGRINRNDVMRALNVDKTQAMKKIDQWIREGVLEKKGHGRDTYYVSGSNMTGASTGQIPSYSNSNPQNSTSSSMPLILLKKLSRRGRINRNDVMRALNVDKTQAMNKIDQWIREGILVKKGHGRDTYYVSGRRLPASEPMQETTSAHSSSGSHRKSSSPVIVQAALVFAAIFTLGLIFIIKPFRDGWSETFNNN